MFPLLLWFSGMVQWLLLFRIFQIKMRAKGQACVNIFFTSPLFKSQYVIAVRKMQSCLQSETFGKDPASGNVCVSVCAVCAVCVVCVHAEGSGMIKQSTSRYSMPSVFAPTNPKKNVLCPALSISMQSLCGLWSVRMKEALSKRLILERLVNAPRLEAGNAATPPSPNPPPSGNGDPQVSIQWVSLEKFGVAGGGPRGGGWLLNETDERNEAWTILHWRLDSGCTDASTAAPLQRVFF